jgi:hypothetical protein
MLQERGGDNAWLLFRQRDVRLTGIPIATNEQRRLSVIRRLKSGKYRLYSRKKDSKSGKRRNLGTFDTREEAEKHERAVQYFKRKS